MRKFFSLLMATFMLMASISTNVFANEIQHDLPYMTPFSSVSQENTQGETDKPLLFMPLINSDGTFTFSVSKGSQLWSDSFKVSGTTSKLTHKTSPKFWDQASSCTFSVTLQKKGLLGWSDVQEVSCTADGTSRYYEFTGLDKSTTYRLYFYSSDYAIEGSGTIGNYVKP